VLKAPLNPNQPLAHSDYGEAAVLLQGVTYTASIAKTQ